MRYAATIINNNMFGIYRAFLALLVVFLHLGNVPRLGNYAVFAFYILSGYLMTRIMHQSYGYSWHGRKRYFVNRFLRIFPLYWVACAASILIITIWGQNALFQFHDAMFMPPDTESWVRNMFLFFPHMENPRLTPPAWALTVELFYYLLIGLGISKYRRVTIAWFIIAALYHGVLIAKNWGFSNLYFPIQAAALPFSIGALIFHYQDKLLGALPKLQSSMAPALLLAGFLGGWAIGIQTDRAGIASFYLALLINAVLIVSLLKQDTDTVFLKNWDKILGDLSYPLYLLHYQAGWITVALASALGLQLSRGDFLLAVLSLPLLLIFAWLLAALVEQPIEAIRGRIRTRHAI